MRQLLLAVVGGVLALLAGRAEAADIVIVRSSDTSPHRATESRIAAELTARGHATSFIPLASLTDERLRALELRDHRFAAVGSDAVTSLRKRLSDVSHLIDAVADVVIVRSSDAPPYRVAEASLRGELTDRGRLTISVPLASLTDERLAALQQQGYDFAAAGSAAAKSLEERLADASRLIDRVADVVIVLSSEAQPYRVAEASLRAELTERGHITTSTSLPALGDEQLARLERDGYEFVAIGSSAAVSLNRRLGDGSLLVYCMASDPEARGLTRRPLTSGISTQVPVAEQFRLIDEALPGVRTVGMLFNSTSTASRALLEVVRDDLPPAWELKAIDVARHSTIANALHALFRAHPDIIWTSNDASVFDSATIRTLLRDALRKETPVFGFSTPFVRAGALLGIGIDPRVQAIDAAVLTDTLITEGLPDDPAQRHRSPRYDLAVHLIVAEELDLELPRSTVSRARYLYPQTSEASP